MTEFEELYLKVREKEKRLYTDAEVSELPFIDFRHPHYYEWRIRHDSLKRLLIYLKQKKHPLEILDLGCGNGWMANRLSGIAGSAIVGIDINGFEIEQAKRVFRKTPRLSFFSGNIFDPLIFDEKKFDVIILGASIQYFPDIPLLINHLSGLLRENGEIHIIDSHFYSEKQITRAREATRHHYRLLKTEKMAEYYHHHLWSALTPFNVIVRNRSIIDRVFLKAFKVARNYFPWLVIKNH
jgi:ubiquinone/menaquinone biosynthesis C-methylase UbiE